MRKNDRSARGDIRRSGRVAATALAAMLALPAFAQEENDEGAAPDSIQQSFKNWAVNCTGEPRQCHLFQRISVRDDGKVILNFTFTVRHDPGSKKSAAILTLPLGINLPAGVAIQVDDGEPLYLALKRCQAHGCWSAFALDTDRLATFKKGRTVTIFFQVQEDKTLSIPASLIGFTAGFNALVQLAGG